MQSLLIQNQFSSWNRYMVHHFIYECVKEGFSEEVPIEPKTTPIKIPLQVLIFDGMEHPPYPSF